MVEKSEVAGSQCRISTCEAKLAAVGDALYAIGGKWKLRIIIAILEKTRRFNELQRLLEGISAKVLSSELKELVLNGFIRRVVHTGTPVIVEYEITEYSHTLKPVLDTLSEWGHSHREMVRKSFQNN